MSLAIQDSKEVVAIEPEWKAYIRALVQRPQIQKAVDPIITTISYKDTDILIITSINTKCTRVSTSVSVTHSTDFPISTPFFPVRPYALSEDDHDATIRRMKRMHRRVRKIMLRQLKRWWRSIRLGSVKTTGSYDHIREAEQLASIDKYYAKRQL
jgi:hypothetical protein